jgi:hypothetical protein
VTTVESPADNHEEASSRRWQMIAGVMVLLGSLATAGYAVVETFWG